MYFHNEKMKKWKDNKVIDCCMNFAAFLYKNGHHPIGKLAVSLTVGFALTAKCQVMKTSPDGKQLPLLNWRLLGEIL
jgi:hypothetical protein